MQQTKYIITFFVFTNLFLVLSSFYFILGRPILNVDYLVLLVFCCFPKNIISHSLLAISFLFLYFIDVLLMVMQIFPFVRLTDLIYLSNFIFNGPVLYRFLLLIIVFNGIIGSLIIRDYFLKKITLIYKQFFIILIAIFIALSITHFALVQSQKSLSKRFNKPWLGSQLLFFIQHQHVNFVQAMEGEQTALEPSRYNNASQPLFMQINQHQSISNKILLIVNESWGETSKASHQRAILQPVYAKQAQLKFLNQGAFNFIGATVAGELRELCQMQPVTFNLKNANAHEFVSCLPNRLKKMGYTTHALHGAKIMMYDRASWYPKAGFAYLYFFDELKDGGLCQAFSGRCDTHLFGDVKRLLLDSNKSFVYWMTLNTHAPYNDIVIEPSLSCEDIRVKRGSETCNNYKLQHQFFNALAEIIDDPAMKGLEVYVVGDHSPPIFGLGDNLLSFKGSEVAWIHFKINE